MEYDVVEKLKCVSKEPGGINGNMLGVRLATLFILSVVIFTLIFYGNNEITINPNPEIPDTVEAVKARDDPGFDALIGNSYINGSDLFAEFHHNQGNPQQISVIGSEDHQISRNFEPGVLITKAVHLDENRDIISDIYDLVKYKDGVWSEPIYEGEYIRVTFEKNLTYGNDITLYARNNQGLKTAVEVYYCNSTEKVTGFPVITEEKYYKVLLTGMHGRHDTFDLKIVNPDPETAYLEFDHIVDPAAGTPSATLNFFMSSEGYSSTDKGPVDNNNFDEAPIQLNDYGQTTEKCETWDCTSWTFDGDKQGDSCTGGWNCTEWNGVTCASYKCEGWTLSGTDKRWNVCRSGWDCKTWNSDYCEFWDCDNWSITSEDNLDPYCSGQWDCIGWNGSNCDHWNCTEWTENTVVAKEDAYCLGSWNCTAWDAGGNCDTWNCTEWAEDSGGDKFDVHCSGGWNCTSWNGNYCANWECTSMTIDGTNSVDFYCDTWNCSTWDETRKVCEYWECVGGFTEGATIKRDYYCFGVYNCTAWKNFTYDNPPNVNLNSPEPNANLSNATVTFNCTAWDDINLTNVSLYGNWTGSWQLNETNSSGINNTDYISAKTIPEGTYTWNCRACDNSTAGQCTFASANRTFTVDTVPPVITILNPENSTYLPVGTTWTWVNISTNENAVCRYNLTNPAFDYATQGTNFTTTGGTSHRFNYSGLSDGQTYNIYYKCNDTFGNINPVSTNHAFTVLSCNCSSCDMCGQSLNDPACSVVYLTVNITNNPGTCINNPAKFSNKIFDCQGNTIDGNGTGYGINITLASPDNITLRNCAITDFDRGIYADPEQNTVSDSFTDETKIASKVNVTVNTVAGQVELIKTCGAGHTDNGDGTCTAKLQSSGTENLGDTYVKQDEDQDSNFGGGAYLLAGWNTQAMLGRAHILIKFNISSIPAGATVNNAGLYIYCAIENAYPDVLLRIESNDGDWDESNVTYNNAPAFGDWTGGTKTISGTGWKSWVATGVVSQWLSGSKTNYGFRLQTQNTESTTWWAGFGSKEYGTSSDRPYLNITYTQIYISSGELWSTNLLSGQTVSSIDAFGYIVSSIPSGTSLKVQFSQDNSTWYNSTNSSGGWDNLTQGSHTIDLSSLGWSGANFYYKIQFTSNGSNTPVLDEINVTYSGKISSNLNFTNNTISNCTYGIYFQNIDNSTIENSNISLNTHGIYIDVNSSNNTINNNILCPNTDYHINNSGSTNTGVNNTCDKYKVVNWNDTGQDGCTYICDFPPVITIHSPENTTYNHSMIDLDVSANEPIDAWQYLLNDGCNVTFTPNSTVYAREGSNHLVVYGNDTTFGYTNSSEVYFTVDLTAVPVSASPIIDTNKTQYWMNGSFDGTQLNNSYEDMILLPCRTTGNYTSAVFDAGLTVHWDNISWTQEVCYQCELPDNQATTETGDYERKANMTGNVLLMHMNEDGTNGTTIVDYSGEGNNGTLYLNSSSQNATTTGKLNTALQFDAVDDYIKVVDDDSIGNSGMSELTFSMWIYPKDDSQYMQLGGTTNNWNGDGYNFYLRGGQTNQEYAFTIDGSYYIRAGNIVTDQWHHLVGTYNGSLMIVYLDGENIGESTGKSGDINNNSADLYMGRIYNYSGVGTGYFNGTIDEVAIYNRSLSADEILDHYKRGILRLNLTVRSCDDSACSGESFTYVNDTSPQNLSVANNRYFQYGFEFETDITSYSPELYNVTIHYTDITPPNVTLISPENGTTDTDGNVTFTCNATNAGLQNITLYVWNSTGGVYYNNTENISGTSNQTSWTLAGMPNGNYEWNCLAYDSADNLNWGDDNWSLTVDHCACLNCTECIQKLNNPACSIVYLNTDITNHPGTCINNPENFTNKTFDCQGYMIDGSGSGSGIYLDGKENNTIRNCVITGFGYGFYLNNSDSNDLINNTANSNNNYDGFYLYYSDSNNLINNTAKRNNRYGFYLYYSDTNTLNGNLVCANEKDIRVRKATGNTGDNNTCQQTQGWNDEGTTGCTYECTADLTILEIVPIGSLIECENMTVNATVKNVGGRDANNYDLSLYKNDNLVEIRTNLPSLAIGATHTETYALNDSYTCACDIWGHTGLNFNLKASITGVAPEEGITENNNKTGAVALVNILEIIPEETTITVSTNATYIIQPHQIINNSDIMGIENISIEYINDTLPASCTNITPDFFSAIPPSNFNFTVNIPCLSNGTSNGTKVTSGFDENGFCVENDTKPVQVTKNESAAVVVCGIVDFGTICTGQGNSTNIKIKNGDSTYYVQNVSYEFPDLADNGNTIPGDQMNASTPLPIPPGTNITSVINITIALNQTPGTYNGTGDVTIGFNNSPQTLILFSLPTQVTVYDCVPPTIINVTDYPDPQNMTGILNITANVSDNIEVSTVLVEITYPDGTIINYTMTKTLPEDGIWYLEFDDTDLQGIYNYTVYVNDTSNNIVNSLKYNFTIGMLNVALDSPGNGSTDTDGNITFTCNVTGVNQLKNITLYTWNSTGVYYTNTTNISGTSNQSIWNVTEIQDGNYTWNCLAYDSADDYDWGDANWSLNIAVPPTVTLISPPNNTLETSNNTIVFRYNVTDSSDMANCSLIINNAVEKTDDTITKDVEQNFTKTLSNGNYNWSVNCTDVYGNEGSSEVRNLSVNVAADVTPPIIYLMSPANDSKTTDNTPDFTFNATDDAATQMNCTLYINGTAYGTNNSVQNNTETTITANSTLDDGTYSWWINCSDGSLTNISETWSFTTDTIPPTINFTSPTPQNNSNLPQNYIPANATAQDPNLANITIYLYNSTDLVTSNTSSTSPFFWNITGLSDGTYYLNATANDTAGNKNSTETRTITLDTTPPNVTLIEPANDTIDIDGSITFTCNVTDSVGLQNITLYVWNSTGGEYYKNTKDISGMSNQSSWNLTDIPHGNYTWNCIASDPAGNSGWGDDNFTFIVSIVISVDCTNGTEKDEFDILYNDVCANGTAHGDAAIYVCDNRTWSNGDGLNSTYNCKNVVNVSGSFSMVNLTSFDIGSYDIVLDNDQDGYYNATRDSIDDVTAAHGFIITPLPETFAFFLIGSFILFLFYRIDKKV